MANNLKRLVCEWKKTEIATRPPKDEFYLCHQSVHENFYGDCIKCKGNRSKSCEEYTTNEINNQKGGQT